jgi:hypothetical protein
LKVGTLHSRALVEAPHIIGFGVEEALMGGREDTVGWGEGVDITGVLVSMEVVSRKAFCTVVLTVQLGVLLSVAEVLRVLCGDRVRDTEGLRDPEVVLEVLIVAVVVIVARLCTWANKASDRLIQRGI